MNFLDRIALSAVGERAPGAARAALPSRFATARGATAAPAFETSDEVAMPAERARASESPASRDGTAAVAHDSIPSGPTAHVGATRVEATAGQVRGDEPTRAARDGSARDPSSPAPSSPVSNTPAPNVLTETARARSHAAAAMRSPTATRAPQADSLVKTSRQPPSPIAAAPLSSRTLERREQAAAPSHPIVNVTIDRIEIRAAPAPAPRAAPPQRQRTAPATQSLVDYLRHGRRSSNGGDA